MTKKYKMFIDAQSDGLYGKILSIAVLVYDSINKCSVDMFDGYFSCGIDELEDEFAIDNVYGQFTGKPHKTEYDLLNAFWYFYIKYKDESDIIIDTPYPVEMNMFRKCVECDLESRKYEGPYPIIDMASILYAKKADIDKPRNQLIGTKKPRPYCAIDNVVLTKDLYLSFHNLFN